MGVDERSFGFHFYHILLVIRLSTFAIIWTSRNAYMCAVHNTAVAESRRNAGLSPGLTFHPLISSHGSADHETLARRRGGDIGRRLGLRAEMLIHGERKIGESCFYFGNKRLND